MSLLKLLLVRLDDLQRRVSVRLTLSALVTVAVIAYFGAAWLKSSEIRRDGMAIATLLKEANLTKRDEVAVQFAEKGTVTVGARTFGNDKLAGFARALYEADGRLANPGAAARLVLEDRIPRWVPTFVLADDLTLALLGTVILGLLLLAIWVGLVVPMVFVTIGTGVLCAFLWWIGSTSWLVAVASIATLLFSFVLLVRGTSLALGRATPIFAIASTVLREAMRLKIATFFVGVLLIAIPVLPLWISRSEPLRYQIQAFIARSMGLLFLLAACMTVFLACATVAFEIRDKQIWQLMTKPVARVQYLLGKWLGVVALNLILVLLGGVAIFTYVQYMQTRPAKDQYDQMAVHEEILVARAGRFPTYRKLSGDEAREIVQKRIDSDPLLKADIENGERGELDVIRDLARQVHQEFLAAQRSIGAGEFRDYVFEDLLPAKRMNAALTLRYAFDIGRIDPHEVHSAIFRFADGSYIQRDFVPAQAHVLTLPAQLIDENGRLEVSIINGTPGNDANGNPTVIPGIGVMLFKPDAFEVLYRVDTFEWNFIRALAVQFMKLAFLSMFGVCAATVLSFPVACVLSFTVLSIGSLAPFLGMSLDEYRIKSDAPALWQAFQFVIKTVATGAEWMLRAFGEVRPTALLVEGRVIGWPDLLRTFVIIGAVWTGGAFVLGYVVFRRKELATYSGNT
ncbi:MAG: hypothetical protein SGJ09_02935 [Phycisphaerae bacterium]|nr:hypothetical protein [Phycisphaerae bacterium]